MQSRGPPARCQYNSFDMSILKVARMGHPVLRAKARPLEKSEIRSVVVQKLIPAPPTPTPEEIKKRTAPPPPPPRKRKRRR